MKTPLERAVTREYRTVKGQSCVSCKKWQQGGVYSIFEPNGVALVSCGFLCQKCAADSGIPVYPNDKRDPK